MLLSTGQREWEGNKVHQLPIHSIFITVKPDDALVERLMESIQKEGLLNPILVVKASKAEYDEKCGIHVDLIPNDTALSHYVYGGSNRVHAAIALGYTAIDVVFIGDFDKAWALQFKQRETKF